MTQDFALAIPPRQNPDAAIVHIPKTRQHEEGFRRQSTADLLALMSEPMQDAQMEIYLGPVIDKMPRVRIMKYVPSVGGMSQEEESAYRIDLRKRYLQWRRHMSKKNRPAFYICLRVCQDDAPIKTVRAEAGVGHPKAINLLHEGLNTYCLLSGWGNQIDGNNR